MGRVELGNLAHPASVREGGIAMKCWAWHSAHDRLTSAEEARAGNEIARSGNLAATAARWRLPGPWHFSHPIALSAASGPVRSRIARGLVTWQTRHSRRPSSEV